MCGNGQVFRVGTVLLGAIFLAAGCATRPARDAAPGWQSFFDGRTLRGWRVTDFAGHGEVRVENGRIILGEGVMTGVTWTNAVPPMNYEMELEAMRVPATIQSEIKAKLLAANAVKRCITLL